MSLSFGEIDVNSPIFPAKIIAFQPHPDLQRSKLANRWPVHFRVFSEVSGCGRESTLVHHGPVGWLYSGNLFRYRKIGIATKNGPCPCKQHPQQNWGFR